MIIKIDLTNSRSGGKIYENKVNDILKNKFEEKYKNYVIKTENNNILTLFKFIYLFVWLKFFFKGTLILSSATPYFAGFRSKNILLLHHFDNFLAKGILGYYIRFCESYISKKKHNFSQLITVAKYWTNFFENKGFTNIRSIYNWFDIPQYKIRSEEVFEFISKYNLNSSKPIIYLGNSQLEKGTLDAYNSLKDKGYLLITSGSPRLKLPILNLNLNFKEYLTLLKAASVTILMSKFPEGWNRIAHESILMGTPVIGSGMGGMKELLEESGQIICENIELLPGLVKKVLCIEKMDMDKAYNYAKNFSIEKFNEAWLNIDFDAL